MKDDTFRQIQALGLKGLLALAEGDPILGPQFRSRLVELESHTPNSAADQDPPRTAVFIRGGGVQGVEGIRPRLAGEALIQYEKMFTEQAIHDERDFAKGAGRQRRPAGSPAPALLFTGTPRGSFGLEFVPIMPSDPSMRALRAKSLRLVSDAIVRVASAEPESVAQVIESVPSSVLQPMKLFMKALAKHEAELRVSYQDRPATSLSTKQLATAYERLEHQVVEKEVEADGLFKGLTLQTGFFDFLTDGDDLISGTVSDELAERDLLALLSFTNQRCHAIFRRTTVQSPSGNAQTSHVLLVATPTDRTEQPVG